MPATVIYTRPAKSVSIEDAEILVTEFLESDNVTIPDGVSKQLQRLQRDMRGLPPLSEAEEPCKQPDLQE